MSYSLEQALNSSVPFETLYQVYYNDYLRRLYAKETRMVVCTAIISLVEFQNLRLNDTIYFQGINYIINSLVYDFNKQMAKLELITRNENIDVQRVIGIGDNGSHNI